MPGPGPGHGKGSGPGAHCPAPGPRLSLFFSAKRQVPPAPLLSLTSSQTRRSYCWSHCPHLKMNHLLVPQPPSSSFWSSSSHLPPHSVHWRRGGEANRAQAQPGHLSLPPRRAGEAQESGREERGIKPVEVTCGFLCLGPGPWPQTASPHCPREGAGPAQRPLQPATAAIMGVDWRSAGPTRSGGSSGALRRVAKAEHSPLFSRGDPLNPTSHLAGSRLTSHCSSLSPPPGLHYQTRCWTPRSHSRRCSCCPRRSRTRGRWPPQPSQRRLPFLSAWPLLGRGAAGPRGHTDPRGRSGSPGEPPQPSHPWRFCTCGLLPRGS
uniref:Uncharacterized protein n=1 Tax=Mustela putorius furo TaxID=9669 RepID=M3YVU1_MUSPF